MLLGPLSLVLVVFAAMPLLKVPETWAADEKSKSTDGLLSPGGDRYRFGSEAAEVERDVATTKTSRRVTPVPTPHDDAAAERARGQLDGPGDGKFGLDEGSPLDDRIRRSRD